MARANALRRCPRRRVTSAGALRSAPASMKRRTKTAATTGWGGGRRRDSMNCASSAEIMAGCGGVIIEGDDARLYRWPDRRRWIVLVKLRRTLMREMSAVLLDETFETWCSELVSLSSMTNVSRDKGKGGNKTNACEVEMPMILEWLRFPHRHRNEACGNAPHISGSTLREDSAKRYQI